MHMHVGEELNVRSMLCGHAVGLRLLPAWSKRLVVTTSTSDAMQRILTSRGLSKSGVETCRDLFASGLGKLPRPRGHRNRP